MMFQKVFQDSKIPSETTNLEFKKYFSNECFGRHFQT